MRLQDQSFRYFPSVEGYEIKEKIFDELLDVLDALSKSKTPPSGSNYVSILYALLESDMRSGEIIDKFVKITQNNIERLVGEDLGVITRLVIALGEIEIKEREIIC